MGKYSAVTVDLVRFFRVSVVGDLVKFLLVVAGLTWLIARGTDLLGYNWQWYRVPKYIFAYGGDGFHAGPLLERLGVTFKITGLSLVLAMSFGLVAALFRLSSSFSAAALARIYMEVTRNTPLLVQLFFVYFVMGPVLGISRFFPCVGPQPV